MFTGIIQSQGVIKAIDVDGDGCRLDIDLGTLDSTTIETGDSIACNGVCLTVVRLNNQTARFDVSLETLDKTTIGAWQVGGEINLEAALSLSAPLGGHLVSGHVDGVGRLVSRQVEGDGTRMTFFVPKPLGRYIANKGSVGIDGVSLTTNSVLEDTEDGTIFEVMIVPHTLEVTSLGNLVAESKIHIEIDLIARYLSRMNEYDQSA